MPGLDFFRSRLFWKIYLTFSLLFFTTLIAVAVTVNDRMQSSSRKVITSQLQDLLRLVEGDAANILKGESSNLEKKISVLESPPRLTVVDMDGKVRFDSENVPGEMNNHKNRPEIIEARANQFGFSERYSDTSGHSMFYVAKSVKDLESGASLGVTRVSVELNQLQSDANALRNSILIPSIIGFMGVAIVGWWITGRVMLPVNEMVGVAERIKNGEFEARVEKPSHDELGRLGGMLNQMAEKMTEHIGELEKLESVRQDFVANVSHEIKTPLTSIRGYVETLKDGAIEDASVRMRFLDKIESNALRLSRLVQDLLSLARIESPDHGYVKQRVNWTEIVRAVVNGYEDACSSKKLKTFLEGVNVPVYVTGDREALVQIVDNLVTNAIKYTPEGGHVTIQIGRQGSQGTLVVRDNGMGIPKEDLGRIFERFYRVDKARSRDLGGTGLGLAIVKHLVNTMDGDIQVNSDIGKGTVFTVKFDLADT